MRISDPETAAMDDRVREMTASLLDAHAERAMEEMSGRRSVSPALLAVYRTLLGLAQTEIREPCPHRTAEKARKVWAGVDGDCGLSDLLPGQFDLWAILHRLLREDHDLHKHPGLVHPALVFGGETMDGVTGALIDAALHGDAPQAPAGWGTLVELGRMRRESFTLNRTLRDLLNARDPAQMFQTLETGILDTFHIRGLAVAAVNHKEGFVEVIRAYPVSPGTQAPLGWRYDLAHPDILCDVARTGRAEVIDGWDPRYYEQVIGDDGSPVLRQRPKDHNRGRTACFVPIRAGGRTIGVVCTASEDASRDLILREIERMQPFLHQAGETLLLVSETIERARTEEALRRTRENLKTRVRERTAELVRMNASLTGEIAERRQAEETLRQVQDNLDGRVMERATELLNAIELLKWEIAERRQAEEALRQALARFNVMVDVSRAVASTLDLDAMLDRLIRRLVAAIPVADTGAVYLFDARTQRLAPKACVGFGEEALRRMRLWPGEGVSGKVFRAGLPAITRTREETEALQGDLLPENRRCLDKGHGGRGIRSSICVPLRTPDGEGIGTIILGATEMAFDKDDLSLLEGIAAETATAVQNARLFEQVRAGQEQLHALSHRLLEVQEEERRHVARELHDEIGQALTAVKVHLMQMQDALGPDAEMPGLEESVAVVERTLQQVRDLSLDLRPAMLDDLGLTPALRWYARRTEQQGGFTVQWDLDPTDFSLPPAVQTTCFRIVQEALTNVVRHARARRVRIEIRCGGSDIHLVVRDDGLGFDVETALRRAEGGGTMGLLGMKERALLLGGQLEVESAAGYGTEIRARIPLKREM